MGLDLGGPAIEVAIGLAFVFFLLSLIVSGITEGIAWAKNLRGKDLAAGIHGMLGDKGIAERVLGHPLVQTDVSDTRRKDPSYVSARNFALALADEVSGIDKDTTLKEIRRGIERIGSGSPLGRQLKALLVASEGELEKFLGATEKWFDDSMDRVSGWYKRHSQLTAIVVAVGVTIALNASTVRIAERLSDEPAVRAAVVAQAEKAVTKEEQAKQTSTDGNSADEEEGSPEKAGKQVQAAFDKLEALQLPILWDDENSPLTDFSVSKALLTLAGWIVTAIAISLGAPFWFDALSKLARLRTTGKRPEAGSSGAS